MGRRKRKGSVRWRKATGKYVIDFYDGLGKRHVETIGTNWRSANNELDERMHQIKTGVFNPVSGEVIFKDYARRWLGGKVGVKILTRIAYTGIIENHLVPYFGEAKLSAIERNSIQDFVKAKIEEKRPGPKTIHNILLVLRQILSDAMIEGLLVRNPFLKIERPRVEKKEMDFLATDEINVLLQQCRGQVFALLFTAIFSGMRRGEIFGLMWGDVDWLNQKIHVRRSLYRGGYQSLKSESSRRMIDMGPRLIQTLKEQRARQNEVRLKAGKTWSDSDLVFCQKDGKPLDPDNFFHRELRVVLKSAGLRRMGIHAMRHTYASLLIAAGHNSKYIQKQLGHSSISVTMDCYGHLMPEVHKGAAEKSESLVFGDKMHSGDTAVTQKEKGATADV